MDALDALNVSIMVQVHENLIVATDLANVQYKWNVYQESGKASNVRKSVFVWSLRSLNSKKVVIAFCTPRRMLIDGKLFSTKFQVGIEKFTDTDLFWNNKIYKSSVIVQTSRMGMMDVERIIIPKVSKSVHIWLVKFDKYLTR